MVASLSDEHKKHMGAAMSFLDHYSKEGDEFLTHTIKGDETIVSCATPASKRQSILIIVIILIILINVRQY